MYWTSGCGRIELKMTLKQTQSGSHSGPCDADVMALSAKPEIRRQLDKVDPAALRDELQGCGAWDSAELADHAQNLQRLLWVACCDITGEAAMRG